MKKIILLIFLSMAGSLFFGNEYEPEIRTTEINDNVGMYIMDLVSEGLGFTAVKINGLIDKNHDFLIASAKYKKFKISGLKCTSLTQALDAEDNELAYLATLFDVKQTSLKKINKKIKKNKIHFLDLIDGLNENDMNSEIHGSEEAPDPKDFKTLRKIWVYDIFVTTEENEEVQLQIYMETFTNSEDLTV